MKSSGLIEYDESDVLYTQLSFFRGFLKRHPMDKLTALRLFEENEVFDFLSDCYESIQLTSDETTLDDIDTILRVHGVTIE